MNRPNVALADVCFAPQYGAIAKGTFDEVGPLLVRQSDLTDGRIDWSTVPYCDLPSSEFEKYALAPDDILISRLGNGVGNAARVVEVKDAVFAGYLVRFRVIPGRAHPAFIGYQLQSPRWSNHVANFRSGAAQPTLNAQQMAEFRFELPPLAEQRAIAEVLSALDDKIKSNQRIQSLSLSLARAMFDQSLHSSTSSRLSDIATIVLGGTPSKSEASFWGGEEIPWINSGAANQEIILTPTEYITSLGLQNSAAKLMPKGATVLAITGATLGQAAILGIETAGNQSLVGIWGSTPQSNAWIHFAIQARINELLTHATGAAQQHVNKQNVEQLMVPMIGPGELEKWGTGVVPLVERAVSAATESLKLAALRDSLLPELLSGRIRVVEASE